jgi:hypothetical protein
MCAFLLLIVRVCSYSFLLQERLLEEAAGAAPVSEWRAAAAALADSSPPGSAATSPVPAAAAARAFPAPGATRQQQLQLLQHFCRRALRATVTAVRLMQQQQRNEGDLHGMMTCLDNLGVLLRDAAMCLAPWHEPWRFKAAQDAGRLQLLRAAQVRHDRETKVQFLFKCICAAYSVMHETDLRVVELWFVWLRGVSRRGSKRRDVSVGCSCCGQHGWVRREAWLRNRTLACCSVMCCAVPMSQDCSAPFCRVLCRNPSQFCFQQAQQVASGWQFPLVLGQVASKLQQRGWQGYRMYPAKFCL